MPSLDSSLRKGLESASNDIFPARLGQGSVSPRHPLWATGPTHVDVQRQAMAALKDYTSKVEHALITYVNRRKAELRALQRHERALTKREVGLEKLEEAKGTEEGVDFDSDVWETNEEYQGHVRAAQQLTQQDAAKDIAKEIALKKEIESLEAHVTGLIAQLKKHQGVEVEQHKIDQVAAEEERPLPVVETYGKPAELVVLPTMKLPIPSSESVRPDASATNVPSSPAGGDSAGAEQATSGGAHPPGPAGPPPLPPTYALGSQGVSAAQPTVEYEDRIVEVPSPWMTLQQPRPAVQETVTEVIEGTPASGGNPPPLAAGFARPPLEKTPGEQIRDEKPPQGFEDPGAPATTPIVFHASLQMRGCVGVGLLTWPPGGIGRRRHVARGSRRALSGLRSFL